MAGVRGERRLRNTEIPNPASRVGADAASPNPGLLENSAVQHHQGLGVGPCPF